VTVSGADGAILLPFQAALIPDELTALVFVNPAPSATIELNSIGVNIEVNQVAAQVDADGAEAGVTINTLDAEVT
jgi:hypothetical protein